MATTLAMPAGSSKPRPQITILKRTREDVSLAQTRFLKKTAKGKVLTFLRERYVRDDIPCGFEDCHLCGSFPGQRPVLPARGFTKHSKLDGRQGHWLVIDTNVVLHQMDLLASLPPSLPLIIPSTTIRETRHRSLPLYNRLQQLIQEEDRCIWVWWNEERRETATFQEEDEVKGVEGINDRNDRAIRRTLHFYADHLKSSTSSPPSLVLLTDDKRNRELAQAEGLVAVSTRDYVDGLLPDERERLVDLVVGGVDETEPSERRARRIYDDYLPQDVLTAGVKNGRFFQGHFNANQYNYLEGTVRVPSLDKPVLLLGRQSMNRSVDGDIVVVEIFPKDQWKAPGEEVVDQDIALRDDDAEDDEGAGVEDREKQNAKQEEMDVEDQTRRKPRDVQPTGRVVGVMKRNWRAYVCHLDRSSLSAAALTSLSQQTVFATPLSSSLPRIRLRTRQAPQLIDQKILVTIDSWSTNSRYPDGHFVRSLGQVESKQAEQESLLLEYEVPYRPFGKAILNCLPKEGESWVVPPKAADNVIWRDREDLRDLIVCSIDPPGCTDIDDALHARQLPNGNIEAGVHIADVSHFVLPDNAMDSEAASRGTTVYLVDNRIDMLPELLGTNLCSLRPFVERLAFSVIWELDQNANIVKVRFSKSVIASKQAFTYEAAQNRKDDKSLNDPLTTSIRLLNDLAKKLNQKRMDAGALSLSSPELKIHLDSSEAAEPIDIEQKHQRETNSLVEEFMLLANISVAAKIQEVFPATAVLRRHSPPPKTNFEALQDILMKRKNMTLDVSSSGALAASLDSCVDPNEPEFNTLVRIMATRCMLAAEYFCSGSVSKEAFGHYGLASPIYTHFTSPIRRYADVLAHRQLAAAINYTPLHPSLQSKSHVEKTLNVVNKRHRLAQMAGRASVEFYVGLALKARWAGVREGWSREDAWVIRTFRNGLAVFVSRLGLEGLITFTKQSHTFDPENYTISIPLPSSSNGTVSVSVFDKIQVEVGIEKDKNTQRGKVRMVMVGPVSSEGL